MLGKRIRELRLVRGLTQSQVALQLSHHHAIDIPPNYVSRIETGNIGMPGVEMLQALADVLQTTDVDLLIAAGWIRPTSDALPAEIQRLLDLVVGMPPAFRELVVRATEAFIEALDSWAIESDRRGLFRELEEDSPKEEEAVPEVVIGNPVPASVGLQSEGEALTRELMAEAGYDYDQLGPEAKELWRSLTIIWQQDEEAFERIAGEAMEAAQAQSPALLSGTDGDTTINEQPQHEQASNAAATSPARS